MSDDVLSDLQRRVANMVRRGVIHSVKHGPQPFCRVEIGENITTWLPLCQGFAGAHRSDSNPCAVGDPVTVLSESGELNNGRVFPGWNTGAMPAPEGSAAEHITRFSDGAEFRYNREAHAFKLTLPEGGTYEIIGKGTLRGPVEITDTLTVKGKTELQADTAVTGDLSATGDISDGKSTLARVREIFNIHTHPDPHGGDTDKPNNQM